MVSAGSYGIRTLNKSNGTLTNKSTLTVSNFNQSNGTTTNSGNLTIGNANLGGTLNSTGTLNLTGNVVTRGNLTSTGNLNNQGNWTETNRYTIAANLNNSGSVNFQNGFEFSNGRLTSSGTVKRIMSLTFSTALEKLDSRTSIMSGLVLPFRRKLKQVLQTFPEIFTWQACPELNQSRLVYGWKSGCHRSGTHSNTS